MCCYWFQAENTPDTHAFYSLEESARWRLLILWHPKDRENETRDEVVPWMGRRPSGYRFVSDQKNIEDNEFAPSRWSKYEMR